MKGIDLKQVSSINQLKKMSNLLAVDIGNTTIVCGVFCGERMQTSWQLSSETSRTPDECWQSTTFFCREAGIDSSNLDALAISSVVPSHTRSFSEMAVNRFDENPLLISAESCPFLEVQYLDKQQVGADRLCNSFAGHHFYGGPLIVVDFGTAITFDVVSEKGAYVGGIIIPGPVTAAKALHQRTAQLPQASLNFPTRIIGTSTNHAIQSGLTWGLVDMIDSLIDRIVKEMKPDCSVIATGGYADAYAERSRNFTKVHHNLVLEGVRLIHQRARGGD